MNKDATRLKCLPVVVVPLVVPDVDGVAEVVAAVVVGPDVVLADVVGVPKIKNMSLSQELLK